MHKIDGAQGEGGGQILRTTLSLSLITGQPVELVNIRARREKPGLRPQHLAAVKAAAAVGNAAVEGAAIGSSRLLFRPREIRSGRFDFEIGTAGSAPLVFQTVFVPLSHASAASSLSIRGGTHVPRSPSFEYLDLHWFSLLRRCGYDCQLTLKSAGFYPPGGGHIQAIVRPAQQVHGLDLSSRGPLCQIRGLSAVANLDRRIAARQRAQVLRRLGDRYPLNDIRLVDLPGRFKGTFLLLLAEFEASQACYFALGALGKPAERVADEAVNALEAFLATDGAVDQYLADQLLLPLALASGSSRLRTSCITSHLLTNAAVINTFLPGRVEIQGELGAPGLAILA